MRISRRFTCGVLTAAGYGLGQAWDWLTSHVDDEGPLPGAPVYRSRQGAPIPKPESRLTGRYGKGKDPFTGADRFHNGIDQAPDTPDVAGDWLPSVKDGRVLRVDYTRRYGLHVVVDHGDGSSTVYAHLYRARVQVGDNLIQGQLVGLMGTSGYSTGVHLHYMRIQTPAMDLSSDAFRPRHPLVAW